MFGMKNKDWVKGKLEMDEVIEMLNTLCDEVMDNPSGCDYCPYGNTRSADGGDCDVMKKISELKEIRI